MRTLIISDIHANITALNAVLDAAGSFDRVWCLGDVVGYGPDPNECIERLKNLPELQCVKGNHDAAIIGEIEIAAFNPEAQTSLTWLSRVLRPKNLEWLTSLEDRIVDEKITMVHGSPRNPVWEYIMDIPTARANMDAFDTEVCLIGHTHIPSVFQFEDDEDHSISLEHLFPDDVFYTNRKMIINPGSVGQPRDHDPRAAFIIYDDEKELWTFHRIDYDIESVQRRIRSSGLPHRHASRLALGW